MMMDMKMSFFSFLQEKGKIILIIAAWLKRKGNSVEKGGKNFAEEFGVQTIFNANQQQNCRLNCIPCSRLQQKWLELH